MTQPRLSTVSVVMPCYNGMPQMSRALESAIEQTHRAVEIIVVDDGSTDDSAACVNHYIHQHPEANIRLIRQTNSGEPAARNKGIHAASGDWVAMLDTDDWWDKTKLAKQLTESQAAGPDCVLVHTGVIHHFPDGQTHELNMQAPAQRVGWATSTLLNDGSIGHPSIMVRRTALMDLGGYDTTFKQACDIDLYYRLSAVGTFAFVHEYLLHYSVYEGQMSSRVADQLRSHHRAIRNFFHDHPELAHKIGRDKIRAAMTRQIVDKLKSTYWRRRLPEFRALLEYADESGFKSPQIEQWRKRRVYPDWLIRVKDRLTVAWSTEEAGGVA
jgi:glycosyltransferase involved in cell wall biosynthesis